MRRKPQEREKIESGKKLAPMVPLFEVGGGSKGERVTREEKVYQVTFRERLIVTERVVATSKADAIRRVKNGEGERDSEMIDESLYPYGHKAVEEDGLED